MPSLIAKSSRAFADMCINKVGLTDDRKIDEVRYGAYFLISALYKLPLMYMPSIIFGVFKDVIISSVIFSVLRFFAGGIHAKTHTGCAIGGNFVMGYLPILIAKLVSTIGIHNYIESQVRLLVFALAVALITLYAPADLESKPIYSEQRRKYFKVIAVMLVVFIYCMSMIVGTYYSMLITTAVLLEALSITPLAYKIFKNQHGNTYKIDEREW